MSFSATGGVKTVDGLFTVHTFDETDVLECSGTIVAKVLRIGAGGGGSIGGGAAGGVIPEEDVVLTGTMPATIGEGGAGKGDGATTGDNGQDTVFGGKTAEGGGGGGADNKDGEDGGSGGGAGSESSAAGTATPAGQGHDGGNNGGFMAPGYPGGGGGGADDVGANATAVNYSGNGGPGLSSDIVERGVDVDYAGGGGAGSYYGSAVGGTASHGGGPGIISGTSNPGAPNTGAGGGGATSSIMAGAGGRGKIVVRYPTDADDNPLLVFDGCSQTNDYGLDEAERYPAQVGVLLADDSHVVNLAVGGATWSDMTADAAVTIDAAYLTMRKSICVAWEGINTLIASQDAAACYAAQVAYCQARQAAGFKVVALTVLPEGDFVAFNNARNAVNISIRANWASFADALADVAADPRIGDDGDEDDTTYFRDKAHMTAAGYAVVAGIVARAIVRLLNPASLDDLAEIVAALSAALDAVKLKTNTIGSLAVTVTSPVAASGTITLSANDDYHTAHGRSIPFDIDDPTHALGLDDVDASVELRCSQATWTATAVETTDGYHVEFEIPHAGLTRSGHYQLKCLLADGDVVTKAKGEIVLERDIPAVA